MLGVSQQGRHDLEDFLPSNKELQRSPSPAPTSTPTYQNAVKTGLHVVYRHVYIRSWKHLRPDYVWSCVLSWRLYQSRRNSLPTYCHRETQHLQPPRIDFQSLLHYCGLWDDNLTPTYWPPQHRKTEHCKAAYWSLHARCREPRDHLCHQRVAWSLSRCRPVLRQLGHR